MSWAGSKVDAWIYRTDSRVAPLVVGLGIWGSLLVGGIAAFVLAIRWLP